VLLDRAHRLHQDRPFAEQLGDLGRAQLGQVAPGGA
jgi:hypothetical protein